jgi:hydrogenase nickel incorporation protein HypB
MAEILIMKAVNEENEAHAAAVRLVLEREGVRMVNFLSSPGAGKTTLLEKTLVAFGEASPSRSFRIGVIEGDLFTDEDARRIERTGAPVVQLNTEGSCHLTAAMIEAALSRLPLSAMDFLFVENVGNLVCPSSFHLGEHRRVTLLSVAEGNDKVKKYPKAFQTADCLLLTKTDMLELTDFSLAQAEADFRRINATAPILALSSRTGEGMAAWFDMLAAWR